MGIIEECNDCSCQNVDPFTALKNKLHFKVKVRMDDIYI